MHFLHNYWFCYENGKEKLSPGLFRRTQIQNEKDKITKVIKAELESDSESKLESDAELETNSVLQSHSE